MQIVTASHRSAIAAIAIGDIRVRQERHGTRQMVGSSFDLDPCEHLEFEGLDEAFVGSHGAEVALEVGGHLFPGMERRRRR